MLGTDDVLFRVALHIILLVECYALLVRMPYAKLEAPITLR